MKRLFLTVVLIMGSSLLISAQSWYVTGAGSDTNSGKTPTTAFRNLQKVAGLVQPGDVVWIGNGIYTNPDKVSAVLSITRSGKPGAWITWKAIPGQHPQIKPTGWAGIAINCSYQIIDGLDVIGANDAIVLLDAQEDTKKASANPYFNTNGIFINGRQRKPEEKPHHNIIRNCVVSNCPGGGVAAIETDYVTVEDCRVFNNAWFMRYAGSGITTLQNWAYDDAPGYHIIIQRNYVWNNKTMVAWEKIGKLSDGNGIILDVTDQEQEGATNPNADVVAKPATQQMPVTPAKPKRPEWKGRALIANNLSAYNGGSGIHTFRTKYVDIINNTTYSNGSNVGYPEMFANSSEDIVFLNNIIVPRPGGKVTSNNKNTNIRWDYNLYPTAQNFFKATHDIIADPKFIDIEADITKGNFRLAKGSAGLNSASGELPQLTDINGKPRPKTQGRDRGAFEQY
jgi:hypothetical protein